VFPLQRIARTMRRTARAVAGPAWSCDLSRIVYVIPALYKNHHAVTLSMPSVLGQTGVTQILEPAMSDEERQALQHSAETLKAAAARIIR
jgi:malate/lactate dehydrogenase